MDPETLLAGHDVALAVYERVRSILEGLGPVEVRATKSQVSFRRRRTFAWVWVPGQYLSRPDADVVLTLALGRHDASARFKEVVHPSTKHWVHHLEVCAIGEIDDEVADWLRAAADRAG